ncbi:hypothetical protein BCR32DRAFT_330478 [Anaeromyces robustus]|uniref:Carbohydrate-binding module family 19 domain-containing protein n=1 Tax=Anaeromyces robustus TaxID=1754192 RepID=A0A1Y1VVV0_9FUNG|nr:hypothetical protein BCR32DRAFT_330478 [Anaeromyces robustus]|eukprot:ORX64884.1 hypothetical protein BCR32DRAFT_330478 [Anaeromyces robustus]
MKYNNQLISSLLTVLIVFTGVNASPIVRDEIVENIKDEKVNTDLPIIEKPIDKPTPIPLPTVMPRPECPLGKGVVMNQLIDCNNQNGKFYRKFHPYPECYSDYVCFLPANDLISNLCIRIDGKIYCSASISNIGSCKYGTKSYNFKRCIQQASEIFPDFVYNSVLPITIKPTIFPTIKPTINPTIIKPTIKPTINPTIIKPTIKPTINPTIIKPTIKPTINPTIIKPTIKPTINPTIIKPTIKPTINPTIIRPTINPTIIRPTIDPTIIKPTIKPTINPTIIKPTIKPTINPTIIRPTINPTIIRPTIDPTIKPTIIRPTIDPTVKPTIIRPTVKPTIIRPTVKPTIIRPTVTKLPMEIETEVKLATPRSLVARSYQPISVTAIPLPTDIPEEAIQKDNPKPECALGLGVVATQYFECTKKNGIFFRKFHPYPECYSDYVCFLPTPGVYINQPCISINGNVYCSADISNIRYCKYGSKSYDFKKCVEASKIFPGFIYKVVKPTTTIIPITKPKTTTTLVPITKPKTTTTTTLKSIFTVKPLCPDGAGEVMNQYIECNNSGGKFYHKFYPYPDCYSDFVCFLPAKDIQTNRCIKIDGELYCSANITNIGYCRYGSKSYNFRSCIKKASELFPEFRYE